MITYITTKAKVNSREREQEIHSDPECITLLVYFNGFRILFYQILVTFEISNLASNIETLKSKVLGMQKVVFLAPRAPWRIRKGRMDWLGMARLGKS